MTDNDIIKYFTKGNRIMKYRINKLEDTNEIIQYLKNRFNDSYSLEESLYRIFYKVYTKGICPICGKPVALVNFKYGFGKTCNSKECVKKYKNLHSSFKNYDIQLKVRETIIKKYGVDNPYKIKHIKEKALKNAHSDEANNKRIKTCIDIYGVDNVSKNEIIKNKISTILSNRSEEEKYNTYIKHKNTFIERFGVDWYSKLPKHKEKISKMMQSEIILSKRKQTSLLKYGDLTYNNQELRTYTMKQNNSYAKSKTEDTVYELLTEKFKNVERQYRSDKYPFNCDFYIYDLDLYIEFNGSHYHHKHPFDENNEEDIKERNKLVSFAENSKRHLERKKSQYAVILYTWTNLDPRKRNTAKENNLNFIEFWNIDEVKNWINKQT